MPAAGSFPGSPILYRVAKLHPGKIESEFVQSLLDNSRPEKTKIPVCRKHAAEQMAFTDSCSFFMVSSLKRSVQRYFSVK